MRKIIIVPLDERPCNYDFAKLMSSEMPYQVIVTPKEYYGNKKIPGDVEKIIAWLEKEAINADGIVVALDTILYGGIVPSRLHYEELNTLIERLDVLLRIKAVNPQILIYGYQLIMRNPAYSSSEEEPDYYKDYGREIHLYGIYQHKETHNIISKEEAADFNRIKTILPKKYLTDYLKRRAVNLQLNSQFLSLVSNDIIDFGIIPQDDASVYGFTALDQQKIRELIEKNNLELNVYMYPGADEVTNTLLAKMILYFEQKRPRFYLKYSSELSKTVIPLYEDRPLAETVKYQVLAAGGIIVESLADADLVLLINGPGVKMREASSMLEIRTVEYDAFRNLVEFVEFADYVIKKLKKPVIVADVAYSNGGDLHLFKLLKQKQLLYRVAAYAGWNTSSNTLGTAIPQGIFAHLYPKRKANLDFLAHRYIEDVGYCTLVRKEVTKTLKEPYHYFYLDGKKGKIVKTIQEKLGEFIKLYLSEDNKKPLIKEIYSPWNRMFEIGLKVELDDN